MFRKICIAGACLFAVGCYYDSQEALYNNVTPVPCDTTNITYTGRIATIIKDNCSSCHSSTSGPLQGNGVILDNFAGLQQQAANGKLMGDINQSPGFNAMPLSGNRLSSCDIGAIQHWVNMGIPNN